MRKPRIRAAFALWLILATGALSTPSAAADDVRLLVELPDMMRQHMLSNMRDHLRAIEEIQQALARQSFGEAADVAERRLGMSSLGTHGAEHMAPFMPAEMRATGTAMHRAASRFAVVAGETAVSGDMPRAIAALAELTAQCNACHNAFRIH